MAVAARHGGLALWPFFTELAATTSACFFAHRTAIRTERNNHFRQQLGNRNRVRRGSWGFHSEEALAWKEERAGVSRKRRRDGDVTWGDECEGRPIATTLPKLLFRFFTAQNCHNPSPRK